MFAKFIIARWSSLVARQAHNLKAAGSNPACATILAANETQVLDATNAEQVLAVNDFSFETVFSNEYPADKKTNWVLISPYGDFPNVVKGRDVIQHFTQADAKEICNEFNSLPSIGVKMMGIPWYVGHPYVDSFKADYPDKEAKGRIKELQARADGLYANVEWNSDGKDLISKRAYHGHSIAWIMRANDKGEFHPFSLDHVGFTNKPNIPGIPPVMSANQKTIMSKEEIE